MRVGTPARPQESRPARRRQCADGRKDVPPPRAGKHTTVVVGVCGLRRGLANSATCVSTLTHLGQCVGTAEPARWHGWISPLAWLSQCVDTAGSVRWRGLGQSVDTD